MDVSVESARDSRREREVGSLVELPETGERSGARRVWMGVVVGRSLPYGVGTGVAVGSRLTVGAADGSSHMPTVAPAPPDLTSLPSASATDQLISLG